MIPKPLEDLIKELSKLPSVGRRSAQKMALSLLTGGENARNLQSALQSVSENVKECEVCGNIGLASPCHICEDEGREASLLCVVEGVDDLWAMERSGSFGGKYHVLGGVVSAIHGVSPEDIRIPSLVKRVGEGRFEEVILALGASVDGQTTAHLIARRLKDSGVKVTALARGIPIGAEVDYMDDGTISLALQGRIQF